jgi:hypothetical protein
VDTLNEVLHKPYCLNANQIRWLRWGHCLVMAENEKRSNKLVFDSLSIIVQFMLTTRPFSVRDIWYQHNFSIEKWPLSGLVGSLSSNSEAIVTAQTALNLTRPQSLALDDFPRCSCQRLTRERAYSPALKCNEGLWKSQALNSSNYCFPPPKMAENHTEVNYLCKLYS